MGPRYWRYASIAQRKQVRKMRALTASGASCMSAELLAVRALSKLDRATELFRKYREAPPEVQQVIEAARAIFDAAPIPIWCKWAEDQQRNLYSNPHYKATILSYEGLPDVAVWTEDTANEFARNDSAAGMEPGGLLVYERGNNPNLNRGEHWWIAKWRQIVHTKEGPRTLVWGAVLSTVAHHRQGRAESHGPTQ